MRKFYVKTKKVHGVGINDAENLIQRYEKIDGKRVIAWRCPYYTAWQSMLKRCYSDKYHRAKPTYAGCSVCEEWLTLSKFKPWMEAQDWEGNDLDKDIISAGNKVYSPETCVFVSSQVNNLLVTKGAARGDFPLGVSSSRNKYRAQCVVRGLMTHLGTCDTPDEAAIVYNKFKADYIREVALTQEPRVQEGLNRWADLYEKGMIK